MKISEEIDGGDKQRVVITQLQTNGKPRLVIITPTKQLILDECRFLLGSKAYSFRRRKQKAINYHGTTANCARNDREVKHDVSETEIKEQEHALAWIQGNSR